MHVNNAEEDENEEEKDDKDDDCADFNGHGRGVSVTAGGKKRRFNTVPLHDHIPLVVSRALVRF